MIVWRDGEFMDAGRAVSAADRGFLVGDGVFETLLVDNGRPAFLAAHLARLRRGAEALAFSAELDPQELRAAIGELARRNALSGRAACRITATRVGGARGLAASPDAKPQFLLSLAPVASQKHEVRAIVAAARRFSAAPTNGFKCIGAYAANMLARMEAARAGADEAVMLNEFGRVACASSANLFLVDGDAIVSPPESEGAMPGVTRACVIEIAEALGVDIRVEAVAAAALDGAPLIFTNSVMGALPGRLHPGAMRPSDLAIRLGAAYEARLRTELSEPSP